MGAGDPSGRRSVTGAVVRGLICSAGGRTRVLIYSPLVSDVSDLSSRRGTETSHQPRYTRSSPLRPARCCSFRASTHAHEIKCTVCPVIWDQH